MKDSPNSATRSFQVSSTSSTSVISGHLPPDITILELYKEHDSHPVNKEILKAFDKINVIESLGTGIERMIAACHASGLPTPVFEYHGSAFVVTILKDAWTRTALESLDLNPDQIKAVSYVKVNGWISSSRYAELYKVPMRTSSRELGELAHKGVFVLVGKGRQSRYELKSNRARIAPIAPNVEQQTKPLKNKGNQTPKRKVSPQTPLQTTLQTTLQTPLQTTPQTIMGDSLGDLSEMELEIVLAIRSNPEITRAAIASNLGITPDGVKYHLKALRIKLGLRHEGPTKKGHWVFGPKP